MRPVIVYDSMAEDEAWRYPHKDVRSHLYANMFVDDVASHAVPVYGRGSNRVTVAPAEINTVVVRALADPHYDLSSAVGSFLMPCVRSLIECGEVLYWLRAYTAEEGGGEAGFRLLWLHPGTARWNEGCPVQKLPPLLSEKLGERSDRQLDPAALAVFRLPDEIRGKASHTIDRLLRINPQGMPDFAREAMASRTSDGQVPFDGAHARATNHRALAKAATLTGWMARTLFADSVTEYFFAWRVVRFAKYCASVRLYVQAELQAVVKYLSETPRPMRLLDLM